MMVVKHGQLLQLHRQVLDQPLFIFLEKSWHVRAPLVPTYQMMAVKTGKTFQPIASMQFKKQKKGKPCIWSGIKEK